MSYALCEKDLENYHALVRKVDELCAAVNREFADQIVCRAGCSGCCRELTLFPVEAAALLAALSGLPREQAAKVAAAAAGGSNGSCPLLAAGLCLVYASRPIICRTHGLPLLLKVAGENRLDFCPENFRGAKALPGQAIINLELLNQALVAINALFIETTTAAFLKSGQRQSISALIEIWKGWDNDAA
jgi:uncharacterized protein